MKNIRTPFCVVILLCLLTSNVFALSPTPIVDNPPMPEVVYTEGSLGQVEPPFTDVSWEHPYAEAIAKAKELKYVNGIGNGSFQPDRSIIAYEVSVILRNIFPDYDATKDTVIQPYGYLLNPSLQLNHSQIATLVLRGINASPYTVRLWSDEIPSNVETDSYNAAYHDGIMACGHGAYDPMTRGEALNFMLTMKERGLNQVLPDWCQYITITEDKVSELEEALLDIKLIPGEVLQQFVEQGWTIHLGTEYIKEWMKNHDNFPAVALTSYKNKTCYIGKVNAIPHEMGHFLQRALRNGTSDVVLSDTERKACKKVLGEYATTNNLEYFAEYFAYLCQNRTNAKKLNTLKDKTPETYAYFESLAANGWVNVKEPV